MLLFVFVGFSLLMAIPACFTIQAPMIAKKDYYKNVCYGSSRTETPMFFNTSNTLRDTSSEDPIHLAILTDTSRWYPEEFQFICPDMKITFKLPRKRARAEVASLLFQCKESGVIHLPDTIKNNRRYYNQLQGKYDVIFLYSNGKYVKHDDFLFQKNNDTVDMRNFTIHPSDLESKYWLTLRTFDEAIVDRVIRKNYSTVSGKKIRGYIFDKKDNMALSDVTIRDMTSFKGTTSAIDGYFEIDVDDYDHTIQLTFSFIGYNFQKIDVAANSRLIVIMEEQYISTEEAERIKTGY